MQTIKEIKKINRYENKIIRDLRALYEPEEEEGYYEPQKRKSAVDDNYIEYKSNGDRDKTLSIEEYFNMTKPYLSNIINDYIDEWKIQLTMETSFFSNKDSSKTYTTHIHNKNSSIFIGYETVKTIKFSLRRISRKTKRKDKNK